MLVMMYSWLFSWYYMPYVGPLCIISPLLKTYFDNEIWWGVLAHSPCLFPAEYLRKPGEAVCPGPSKYNIIKLYSNIGKLEVQIHACFWDVLCSSKFVLICTLYWSLQECQAEETRERQKQAIKHSFKGCITPGTRKSNGHKRFALCLQLLPWYVVCLIINFLTH